MHDSDRHDIGSQAQQDRDNPSMMADAHPHPGFIENDLWCIECGGALRGLSTLGQCPACGTSIRTTLESVSGPEIVVARSCNCVLCGYDLRGLNERGACPECATPVEFSLRGNLLRFASSQYVKTIHRGLQWVTRCILGMILSVVVFFLFMAFAAIPGTSGAIVVLIGLGALGILTLAFMIGINLGWWWTAAIDPGQQDRPKGEVARKIVRITVLVNVLGVVGSWALGTLSTIMPSSAIGAISDLFGLLLMFIVGLSGLVGYFAQMLHVRVIADRIPDAFAAKRAKTMLWLGPVLTLGYFGSFLVASFAMFLLGPFAMLFGFFGIILPLIALVLYWNLLDRVRKSLRIIVNDMRLEEQMKER